MIVTYSDEQPLNGLALREKQNGSHGVVMKRKNKNLKRKNEKEKSS